MAKQIKTATPIVLTSVCPFTPAEVSKLHKAIVAGTDGIESAHAGVLATQTTLAAQLRDYTKTVKGRELLSWAILPLCQTAEQRDKKKAVSHRFFNLRNTLNREDIMGKGKAYTIKTTKADKDSKKNLTSPPPLVVIVKADTSTSAERIKFSVPAMFATSEQAMAEFTKVIGKLPVSMLGHVLSLSDVEIKTLISRIYEARVNKARSEAGNNRVATVKAAAQKKAAKAKAATPVKAKGKKAA